MIRTPWQAFKAALVVGAQAVFVSMAADVKRVTSELKIVKKYGTCGWCGEVMHQPIHRTDCPASAGDRELMGGPR